jgi:hypothetical protein
MANEISKGWIWILISGIPSLGPDTLFSGSISEASEGEGWACVLLVCDIFGF